MWKFLDAVGKKVLAGSVIIAGTYLGEVLSLMITGVPIGDPAVKLILVAMVWQIWDNVIVPAIEDLKPQATASEGVFYSMKLIG